MAVPYGPPPAYGGYPGAAPPPAMGAPPGLGPPPGMSSAPGMAPPGIQQHSATHANRPSGLPPNFQPPPNLPNINFNAPVIRLGTGSGKPGTPAQDADRPSQPSHGRPGLGMERGGDHGRQPRDAPQMLVPPSNEEKVRTIFVHRIPESLNTGDGIEKLLGAVGKLRRWDACTSVMEEHKGAKFGFALYDDPESLSTAIKLLHEQTVEVPLKRQPAATNPPPDDDDTFEGIEKAKLQVSVDESSLKYIESYEEEKGDDAGSEQRLSAARAALKQVIRELFYPPVGSGADADGDVSMKNSENGENVEVVNITLAQEDELSDIPAEMREVVAGEIAAFRERSNQRDLERLRKEEEMEEMERRRNGAPRSSRLATPPGGAGANNIPLGPRGAPSGPKSQNGVNRVPFVNGGVSNAEYSINREDEDTDADDEELYRRQQAKQKAEADKSYAEMERKWANRERSRQAALEREQERERQESETLERRKQEQLERDKAWDDDREASRKSHLYYRDPVSWARKRDLDRVDEEARDEADRRAEQEEHRRERAKLERARGMADSFLDRQTEEMERQQQQPESVSAPQPFKLSLGAAAQKAQASRGGQRRTIAEVEGLLDDEEADTSTKRQLIPIQFEPTSATAGMTDEEITQAVRSLAQEIPSDKQGLWSWEVKWDFMDESVIRDKLRPFVEKKIVEYLGVQEEMLVETVEEHLRSHGTAAALAEELEGALDDEAEDLVKKLWRMVIFFTESEKRGLPA
ncbi:snRNP-associated protein-like protein [Hapsidospora chrysogenum ATCC 11550]|uniref:SnRNP-associated protein-like protein n=1 Tax=Hapsidospora chrysogenum (strain ATCC 11550 / CBS 779.69 / DSM 880 / IAM 14645 / JCM 23072 / IMI 49137) TaxID=857340 RepID=A0A086T7F1_HAPC1|nr:snRNP-associated protein-like protein [Hapsidospora chrysogenum ATCC 11550]